LDIKDIQKENNRRLSILYTKKNDWLMSAAYNLTKNRELAKELVAELYLYIAERGNPNIWWKEDDFNMLYLHAFLRTRNINAIKQKNKIQAIADDYDEVEIPYDEELDMKIQNCYDDIVDEIQKLQGTKQWASARLAELYFFSEEKITLDKLSKNIGISKSTTFLNVRKIKHHLKAVKDNPFRN
jgi:DNA-directed RNA polymerase specialized sigma24 family protein